MEPFTVILPHSSTWRTPTQLSRQVEMFAAEALVARVLILCQDSAPAMNLTADRQRKIQRLQMATWLSGIDVHRLLEAVESEALVLIRPGYDIDLGQRTLERFLAVIEEAGAGLVYSDFHERRDHQIVEHPTIAYQLGSIRDTFDFGPLVVISRRAAGRALDAHGAIDPALRWAGFYDLRLKLSLDAPLVRIPESLYTASSTSETPSPSAAEKIFEYVDPRNRSYQLEMERVATAHLRRLGAYLDPVFALPPPPGEDFPVTASVVIPVRNREKTIAEAVHSALGQSTSFAYNVIVIDNHSTDGTTGILRTLAARHERLIHKIPRRTDLGIGGCWNEAITAPECGMFAVQLDSDDLYADTHVLERIIEKFWEPWPDGSDPRQRGIPRYAMVIGSYTTVNVDLEEIPPGLVDHREWTRENGRNNALRINGLGAPRAFYVPLLRRFGFPNVSYGEDYAVGLRISREYEIGRIFDSLYLARRWEENTDRALPLATMNRYDAYKDWLRSMEIRARQRMRSSQLSTTEVTRGDHLRL